MTTIRVLHDYNNGDGARISAGEYDVADVRLMNLGGYLIDTGHAERVEEIAAVEVQPERKNRKGKSE